MTMYWPSTPAATIPTGLLTPGHVIEVLDIEDRLTLARIVTVEDTDAGIRATIVPVFRGYDLPRAVICSDPNTDVFEPDRGRSR